MATLATIRNRLMRMSGDYATVPDTDAVALVDAALNEALREASDRERFKWWDTKAEIALAEDATQLSLPGNVMRVVDIIDPDGDPMEQRTRTWQVGESGLVDDYSDLATYSLAESADYTYYSTGTITWANGSASVTGAGTTFASAMIGKAIKADDDTEWAWITAVADTTTLTVNRAKTGSTVTAGAYKIDPVGTRKLQFYPAIGTAGTYTMIYSRLPVEMSGDTDVPDLPESFHNSYLVWKARAMLLHESEERAHLHEAAERMAERAYRRMQVLNCQMLGKRVVEVTVKP